MPQYNFKQLLERMRFRHTLTPHPESIYSMVQVRAECNRVSFNMCLFFVPTPKAMRLDDFEQSQSQATSHVSPWTYVYWTGSCTPCMRNTFFFSFFHTLVFLVGPHEVCQFGMAD